MTALAGPPSNPIFNLAYEGHISSAAILAGRLVLILRRRAARRALGYNSGLCTGVGNDLMEASDVSTMAFAENPRVTPATETTSTMSTMRFAGDLESHVGGTSNSNNTRLEEKSF